MDESENKDLGAGEVNVKIGDKVSNTEKNTSEPNHGFEKKEPDTNLTCNDIENTKNFVTESEQSTGSSVSATNEKIVTLEPVENGTGTECKICDVENEKNSINNDGENDELKSESGQNSCVDMEQKKETSSVEYEGRSIITEGSNITDTPSNIICDESMEVEVKPRIDEADKEKLANIVLNSNEIQGKDTEKTDDTTMHDAINVIDGENHFTNESSLPNTTLTSESTNDACYSKTMNNTNNMTDEAIRNDSMVKVEPVDSNNTEHTNSKSPFDLKYIEDVLPVSVDEIKKEDEDMEFAENEALWARASAMLGMSLISYSDTDESGNESDSEDSSSSSEESSSTDSSSSSESSDEEEQIKMRKIISTMEEDVVDPNPPKTKDEILIQELPEEAELKVDLPDEASLNPAGNIQGLVEQLIVVKGIKGCPALDAETIFFKKDRKPFGKVFDVFGPVQNPFYSIRVKKQDELESLGLEVAEEVYYAPNYLNLTNYVFLEQLKKMKGSDASWNHDQEPPSHCIDYSDDEEEAKAKAARKKRNLERKKLNDGTGNELEGESEENDQQKEKKGHTQKRKAYENSSHGRPSSHRGADVSDFRDHHSQNNWNPQQNHMNEDNPTFIHSQSMPPRHPLTDAGPPMPPNGYWPQSLAPRFNPRPFRRHLDGEHQGQLYGNPGFDARNQGQRMNMSQRPPNMQSALPGPGQAFPFDMRTRPPHMQSQPPQQGQQFPPDMSQPPPNMQAIPAELRTRFPQDMSHRPANMQSGPPSHGYRFPPETYRPDFDPTGPPPFPRHASPNWRPPF